MVFWFDGGTEKIKKVQEEEYQRYLEARKVRLLQELVEATLLVAQKNVNATTSSNEQTDRNLEEKEPVNDISSPDNVIDTINQTQYAFYRTSDYWHLVFEDERGDFKNLLGFQIIHRLLKYPFREISCIQLVSGFDKVTEETPDSRSDYDLKSDEIGIRVSHSRENNIPVLDQEAMASIRKGIEVLKDEIALRAELGADASGQKEELSALLSDYQKQVRRDGKSRTFSNDYERSRKNALGAIQRTLKIINQNMPKLFTHLNEHLSTGGSCVYASEIKWELGNMK